MKILNPIGNIIFSLAPLFLSRKVLIFMWCDCFNIIGFKLLPAGSLQKCHVIVRGQPASSDVRTGKEKFAEEHVWWLLHPNSKQMIAAYEDSRYGLRELPLTACVQIWGWKPSIDDFDTGYDSSDEKVADRKVDKSKGGSGSTTSSGSAASSASPRTVEIKGDTISIPKVPRKYLKFIATRDNIYREISNMSKLGSHPNVLKLIEALELVQDTKTTIFLVLELASGGELFDRIKVDEGAEEETSRRYFRELLSGISYCHLRGVCHRLVYIFVFILFVVSNV